MEKGFTNKVFMVRPASFGMNPETAETNAFQSKIKFDSAQRISEKAKTEFDNAVEKLRTFGIAVQVFEDTLKPIKPDAVFPNNWVSTHPSKQVFIYPMLVPNRQVEVREDVLKSFNNVDVFDLRKDAKGVLEGTGSLVIDHASEIIYFCHSERTDKKLAEKVAKYLGFTICGFHSTDHQNNLVYHTNVVMFVMQGLVGIGLETIKGDQDRELVLKTIKSSGKELLELSYYQITQFAGNMIQLETNQGNPVLVCSETAWKSLDESQKEKIESKSKVCTLSISTIELYGGGSARCMIAEIFV
ncbi:MAG: citrulline utilization hydrolase CtlX [Salibacteraceae bacterium]